MLQMAAMETGRVITKEITISRKWGIAIIQGNDQATKFYTGLSSYAMFLWLFK